jgi:Zn-dependent peptidase ImmA (M78 family)/RNA polymerase subunit RPABC4/transcription elongation factor Spt4
MKTMMTMIYKPNYAKAEKAAYELLQISNSQALPIKVKKLAKCFSNLKIKTYSWFADKNNLAISEVCDFANSDEGCCYYEKSTGRYLILYNDLVENQARIRWTIAHELGHFMLNHNEIDNKTILGRGALSRLEYDVYEKEANCFARTLLAPPHILSALGSINPHLISDMCNISFEASNYVFKYLIEGARRGVRYIPNKLMDMFNSFIFEFKYGLWCFTCNHSFASKDVKFCPVCGQQTLAKGKGEEMIYSGHFVDDNSRASICPKCENEHLNYEGDYCIICGTDIVNKCAPTYKKDDWSGMGYEDKSCEALLDGDARYCMKCGNESTFLQQGILKDWESEKKEIEAEIRRKEVLKEPLPF